MPHCVYSSTVPYQVTKCRERGAFHERLKSHITTFNCCTVVPPTGWALKLFQSDVKVISFNFGLCATPQPLPYTGGHFKFHADFRLNLPETPDFLSSSSRTLPYAYRVHSSTCQDDALR